MSEISGEMRKYRMRTGSSSNKNNVGEPEEVLNRLPEDIQRRIISTLPIQDALRASILSTKWRKMWYSLSRMIFNYGDFPNMERKAERFAEFIDQTLIRHDASNIELFELRLLALYGPYPCINNEWLSFAVEHNVQNLILYGQMKEEQSLPCCLFTCKSLDTLDLSLMNYVLRWPRTVVLPNLRVLNLRGVIFTDENLILELSSSCPSLKGLTIIACNLSGVKFFSISAPITYLNITVCRGIHGCGVKLRTPLLEEFEYEASVARDYDFANVSQDFYAIVKFLAPTLAERNNVQRSLCAIKFYREIRNATQIILGEWFIELLSQAIDVLLKLEDSSFDNLAFAKFTIWPIKEHIQTLAILLSRCPNLSALHIVISKSRRLPGISNLNWEYMVIGGMLNHLEFIKIKHLDGSVCELELVKLLLLTTPVLIEMKIVPPKKRVESGGEKLMDISDESWMMIRQKVLEFTRVSAKAIISFS